MVENRLRLSHPNVPVMHCCCVGTLVDRVHEGGCELLHDSRLPNMVKTGFIVYGEYLLALLLAQHHVDGLPHSLSVVCVAAALRKLLDASITPPCTARCREEMRECYENFTRLQLSHRAANEIRLP